MKSPVKGDSPRDALRQDKFRRAEPKKSIPDLLFALAKLEATTRPENGADTAHGKDKKSVMALGLANELVRAVAGWAIDHQTGLALQGRGSAIEVLPELGRHPLLSIALAIVDDHCHELEGAERNPSKLKDPIIARKALMNLLQTNPGAFPPAITSQMIHALEGLDYNEIEPILQPVKARKKIGLSEWNMQLSALMWVAHYVGRGFTKKESLERVAGAFGIRIATLRSWQLRVPEELGKLRVANSLENASVYDDKYEDRYDDRLISEGKQYRAFLNQKK